MPIHEGSLLFTTVFDSFFKITLWLCLLLMNLSERRYHVAKTTRQNRKSKRKIGLLDYWKGVLTLKK